jgi:F-type H+-transporting ATPase subunit epsilon
MSPDLIELRVITPDRLLVSEQVEEVTLPGIDGYIGILPGHRPLITALGRGKLSYRKGKRTEDFFVSGGYAEIKRAKVVIFTKKSEEDE